MADENPMGRAFPDPPTPADVDRKAEWAVLAYLLDEHPDQFTIPEVSRVMNEGKTGFDSEDAVERAIRQLVSAGLLHCCGGFVLPTKAALYYWRLEE
ncbi:MAG TPA: hypothetical protein VFI09_01165 [Solirubrobacterales bacterium]|nr:hypothetical protein [Solirubrobacterales bacterium]